MMKAIYEAAIGQALRRVMLAQLSHNYEAHMRYSFVCVWCRLRIVQGRVPEVPGEKECQLTKDVSPGHSKFRSK